MWRRRRRWKSWWRGSGLRCWGWSEWGCNDNFFELGGHSLLATQVMTRIRESLKVNVALRILFESSTLFEFARHVETQTYGMQAPQAPPVLPVPRKTNLPALVFTGTTVVPSPTATR